MKSKCWIAKGFKMPNGYISVCFNNKRFYAHRVSYVISIGKIPRGLYVCHKCDNPPCYRPSHLFLGTQKDNIQDMVKKGRAACGDKNGARKHPEKHIRGENHIHAKLTRSEVIEIRKLYSDKKLNMYELAKKFNITPASICLLIHRKRYANI